jgi:hypothetical protein
VEIAGALQESIRPSRRRLWQAFSFVLGVIIFAAVAYREGWEAVLFLLIFLAIWQLATFERQVISSRRFPSLWSVDEADLERLIPSPSCCAHINL